MIKNIKAGQDGREIMRAKPKQYSSSQISPSGEIWESPRDMSGMYTHMLLEDFCGSYSVFFSPNWHDRHFYDIEPSSDPLKNILTLQEPWDLDRILDRFLSEITRILIEHRKAHVEIIIWKDNDGSVKGISFKPLKPIISITGIHKSLFISRQYSKNFCLYRIEHKRLIVFDLHDLGYSRQFFTRILKRINKRDITKVSDFTFNKNLEFDFTKYAENEDYQLLKNTKGIHWYGRNSSNQYMDSFYLVWREAKFRCLRKRIFDYLLDKINAALIPYRGLACFSGKVIANCKNVDYSQEFEKLQNGEISVSQFSDKLYLNPKIVAKTEDE